MMLYPNTITLGGLLFENTSKLTDGKNSGTAQLQNGDVGPPKGEGGAGAAECYSCVADK
jgi:hypothetical protein